MERENSELSCMKRKVTKGRDMIKRTRKIEENEGGAVWGEWLE